MESNSYISHGALHVHPAIWAAAKQVTKDIINKQTGRPITPEMLFKTLEELYRNFSDENRELLEVRKGFQSLIDQEAKSKPETFKNREKLECFLEGIKYIVKPKGGITITGSKEPDIASRAGPQCVLPVDNYRYATRGAGRFESLLDSVYGGNLIPETDGKEKIGPDGHYNPSRGAAVSASQL